MSDSSPEDFLQQALKLITELKKALEASFEEQDKRINGLFSAQDTRIDDIKDVLQVLVESFSNQKNSIAAISTKYESLNTKFQEHKTNHVSKLSMDDTIKAQILLHSRQHNQELQNIKTKFISVEKYDSQITALNAEIAELKKQIKNIPQSTALTEGVTGAHEQAEKEQKNHAGNPNDLKESSEQTGEKALSDESREANTPPANLASPAEDNPSAAGVPPTQDTQHNQSTPPKSTTPPTDPTVNDPNASTLKTAILKAILASTAYTSIINTNRGLILKKANPLVSSSVNDTVLHIQVILALYYLIDLKSKTRTLSFYNKCYQNNSEELKRLQPIIESFICSNELKVTHDTFQKAIHDSNFKNIMPTDVVLTTNFDANFIDPIIKPKNKGAKQ